MATRKQHGHPPVGSRSLRATDLAGILHRPGLKALTIEQMDEAIGDAIAEDDERIQREYFKGSDDRR